jgi:hypothetical protein
VTGICGKSEPVGREVDVILEHLIMMQRSSAAAQIASKNNTTII